MTTGPKLKSALMDGFHDRAMKAYAAAVAAGEHDDECEYPTHSYICHCSKRRRIAAGFTEPPGELIWEYPTCPRCNETVEGDADGFTCARCCCSWGLDGQQATFYDDYGDAFAEPTWTGDVQLVVNSDG